MEREHLIHVDAIGRNCGLCETPANHTVTATVFTGYVCCRHYRAILGDGVPCPAGNADDCSA